MKAIHEINISRTLLVVVAQPKDRAHIISSTCTWRMHERKKPMLRTVPKY